MLEKALNIVRPSFWSANIAHLAKIVERRHATCFDPSTGMYYELFFGKRVFVKTLNDYRTEKSYRSLCENVYFKHYLPKAGDTVVDIGAGYGHEAIYLHSVSPSVRYIGVEAQPSVYECLSNTLAPFRPIMAASPFAISDGQALWLASVANYEVASSQGGCVEVPTLTWKAFCDRYGVKRVSLLKMNIEGGEKPFLRAVGDLSQVDRTVIACHDWIADRGGSDFYRTEKFVTETLTQQGFKVTRFPDEPPLGWIFAEREAS